MTGASGAPRRCKPVGHGRWRSDTAEGRKRRSDAHNRIRPQNLIIKFCGRIRPPTGLGCSLMHKARSDPNSLSIGIPGTVGICDRVRRERRAETGLSRLPSLSRLSCWLDQKPHQRDQRDSRSACRDRPRGRGGATTTPAPFSSPLNSVKAISLLLYLLPMLQEFFPHES